VKTNTYKVTYTFSQQDYK